MKKLINLDTLKSQKGFTLIELLVVIAIIGILAAIVLIGLNPAQRISETNEAKAQADVRQGATIVETCVTKELSKNPPTAAATIYSTGAGGCANTAYLTGAAGYARNWPTSVAFVVPVSADRVCLRSPASGTALAWWSTTTGVLAAAEPVGCS